MARTNTFTRSLLITDYSLDLVTLTVSVTVSSFSLKITLGE